MSVGFFKVGQPVTISFAWWDSNDAPITATLTPTPTVTITEPDGTETVVELVKRGSTAYWDYVLTPDAAGVWALQGYCADTSVAVAYPDVIALWVTENDLADIPALVWNYLVASWGAVTTAGGKLLDALNTLLTRTSGAAGVTIVSPVREVGGETEIVIKQGETMLAALGNAIVLTFTGVPDTSGCACVLTFTDQNGRLLSSVTGNPFTGSLGTWAAGSVTATWELSAAQTALFPASRNDKEDLERHNLRFEAKITGYASSGVLKPVMPKTGNVRVVTAAWTG